MRSFVTIVKESETTKEMTVPKLAHASPRSSKEKRIKIKYLIKTSNKKHLREDKIRVNMNKKALRG